MNLKSHKACSNCRKQKACPLFPFVTFAIDAEIGSDNMILQSKCVKKDTEERCRMCKAKGLECVFEQRTARKQPM